MDFSLYKSIDPGSILRDLLKNLYLALLIALSVAMLTQVYLTNTYKPTYTTQTTMVVTNKRTGSSVYDNLNSAKEIAERFKSVLEGTLLQKTVMEDLSMTSFDASCKASQVPETNMIQLSVTASNPKDAFNILQSILNNYRSVSEYIVGTVYLEIIEQPLVPTRPVNPLNTRPKVVKAFIVSLMALLALFTLLSISRDTVKNEEQLKEKIDAYPLGIIHHERKSGYRGNTLQNYFLKLTEYFYNGSKNKTEQVSMLINNPTRSYFYVEDCRMTAQRVRSRMDRRNMKVLLFTSVTENEGKSTVAANVAMAIAEKGKKVLLIDADFRKPSVYKLFGLGEDTAVNLIEYLDQNSEPDNEPAKRYKKTDLYLIANRERINIYEQEINYEMLGDIIAYYRKKMDYIIIDTAPMALVTETEAIASYVDGSVLVVREDIILSKHINDSIDVMNESGAPVLGCIFNDASNNIFRQKRDNDER